MRSALCKTLLFCAVVLVVGCASGAGNWGQFHGDLASRGFQAVDSGFALSSAWISRPYAISTSSPVIGKDLEGQEVIYVGTTDSLLIAIKSEDGSQKWSRALGSGEPDSTIVASPAVSDKGDVYIITNYRKKEGKIQSTLYKVDQFSIPQWSYTFPDNGFTTGSPKVLATDTHTLVFVYVSTGMVDDIQGELMVLQDDVDRVELLDRKQLSDCRYGNAGGPELTGVLNALQTDRTALTDFANAPDQSGAALPDTFVDPTPAILINGEKILIAVTDNLCNVGVYQWDGQALSVLWYENHDFKRHSSAALLPGGMMVFGRADGKVFAFDAQTGVKLWTYDAGEPVLATPCADADRSIFVISKNHVQLLNGENGTLISDKSMPRKLQLIGPTHSSAAVTDNRIYIATGEMLTVTHDLKTRGHDTNFRGNGLSSVAIGNKGDIFAVGSDGKIRKYKGTD